MVRVPELKKEIKTKINLNGNGIKKNLVGFRNMKTRSLLGTHWGALRALEQHIGNLRLNSRKQKKVCRSNTFCGMGEDRKRKKTMRIGSEKRNHHKTYRQ